MKKLVILLATVFLVLTNSTVQASEIFLPLVGSGEVTQAQQISSTTTCPAWIPFEPSYYDGFGIDNEVWAAINSFAIALQDGETHSDLVVPTPENDRYPLWGDRDEWVAPLTEALDLLDTCGKLEYADGLSGRLEIPWYLLEDWENAQNLVAIINYIGGYATDSQDVMADALYNMNPEIEQHMRAIVTYYDLFR